MREDSRRAEIVDPNALQDVVNRLGVQHFAAFPDGHQRPQFEHRATEM